MCSSWSGENLDEELESGLITCNSTHLTSFAVLVGVGDTQGVSNEQWGGNVPPQIFGYGRSTFHAII